MLVLAALLAWSQAAGPDALRGKRLYLDAARLTGSGVSCVDCHSAYPPGLFGIGRAANRPDLVAQAVSSVPQMTPLRGRLGPAEIADLAAYLGDPDVPSPAVRAPSAVVLRADGVTAATVRVESAGELPVQLLGDVVIDGVDAAAFAVRDATCVAGLWLPPGESCRFTVELVPGDRDGRRVARASVAHDWVHGAAAVALIGDAGDAGGGCGVGAAHHRPAPAAALVVVVVASLRPRDRVRARSRPTRGAGSTPP